MSHTVICPKCGQAFNADDPRVRSLSPATYYVWHHAPERFRLGAEMGPSELAQHVNLTPEAVYYHLRKLQRAGLVARIPINDRVKRRHRYAGVT
jgi:DNA-binding transcriptional ArsR family regulator